MKTSIIKFLRDEEGATAIEYGLIAGLMATILVAVFSTNTGSVGAILTSIFDKVKTASGA